MAFELFLVLIQNELRIICDWLKKYAYVYSAGPCCNTCLLIMKTPFISDATANRTLLALIFFLSLGVNLSQDYAVCLYQPLPEQTLVFTHLLKSQCEKEKRAISPFSTVFSTLLKNFLSLSSNSKLSFTNSLSLERSNICRLGRVTAVTCLDLRLLSIF